VQSLLHHDQAAIIALFRVINRYVGNLPPMPGSPPVMSSCARTPDILRRPALAGG
jgi:hypothetical protein